MPQTMSSRQPSPIAPPSVMPIAVFKKCFDTLNVN